MTPMTRKMTIAVMTNNETTVYAAILAPVTVFDSITAAASTHTHLKHLK